MLAGDKAGRRHRLDGNRTEGEQGLAFSEHQQRIG
jgi:hypothetical protein